jgi:hypothetical protein
LEGFEMKIVNNAVQSVTTARDKVFACFKKFVFRPVMFVLGFIGSDKNDSYFNIMIGALVGTAIGGVSSFFLPTFLPHGSGWIVGVAFFAGVVLLLNFLTKEDTV